MYVPSDFVEARPEMVAGAIAAARVGELVTMGADGLEATTLPMLFEPVGPQGRLIGHLARANPQWRSADAGQEALVIFRAADAYVTPSYYPSKADDGRVVPTWNYVSVQAWGPLVVHDDPRWVEGLVRRLTDYHESFRQHPWSVDDAPAEFVEKNLRAIVGIEIPISRLQAKSKLSQNRSHADAEGVVAGLSAGSQGDQRVAEYMTEALSRRSPG
jgi:transcriptional regulator